jgi:hypothetical protein
VALSIAVALNIAALNKKLSISSLSILNLSITKFSVATLLITKISMLALSITKFSIDNLSTMDSRATLFA